MIPIRDTIRARSFSVVNWLFILANIVVFLYESSLDRAQVWGFVTTFGLIPASIDPTNPFTWYPFLTHMFLHGGWFHLISNLWILFIFGDNVEDRMGSGAYLVFYLLGGIAAALLQSWITTNPTIPTVGASGAIAAVMGAYVLFYPRARVLTLIPIVFIPWLAELPALVFLGIWFISQLYSGFASLSLPAEQWGGVAWWAHIGGFIFGLLLARLFVTRPRRNYFDGPYPPLP